MGLFTRLRFKSLPTEEEIQASQVDHFSSEERVEHELKKIIGAENVQKQREYLANFEKSVKECEALAFTGKGNVTFEKFSAFPIICFVRKGQLYAKGEENSNKTTTKCFTDEEMDEVLNVDTLLKQPEDVLQRKLGDFDKKLLGCMFDTNSDIFGKTMEIMNPQEPKKPYSAILSSPVIIEIFKSRYLPTRTNIEKKEIEPELMEPFVFNPKTDNEQDYDRKLVALSKSEFLKHDLEYIRKCYQSKDPSIRRDCYTHYKDIVFMSCQVLCKREALMSGQLKFPNIEDSSLMDLESADRRVCSKLFSSEKLFPNMPDFTTHINK